MVKVGFIVEDKAFEATVKSDDFLRILEKNNLDLIGVYKVNGRDNLRNYNVDVNSFFKILIDKGSEYIFVLIDKETDPCITFTLGNIHDFDKEKQINIVAVKAIESWFLADSKTLSELFEKDYEYVYPEKIKETVFDVLKKEFIKHTGKGLSKKRNLHVKYIINNGFSLQNAAKHPNCPSAKYFLKKLSELNPNL